MILVFLGGWLFFALIGWMIGYRRGTPLRGFVWGLVLGPMGCLLIAITGGRRKICPACGELVSPRAVTCRYCRNDLGHIRARNASEPVVQIINWGLFLLLLLSMAIFMLRSAHLNRLAAEQSQVSPHPVRSPPPSATRGAPQETDVTLLEVKPPAESPPPPPPPTPKSEAFQIDVGYSQRAAVEKYPALGVKGSAFNARFLARLAEWRKAADLRLDRSDWPERLADECAR